MPLYSIQSNEDSAHMEKGHILALTLTSSTPKLPHAERFKAPVRLLPATNRLLRELLKPRPHSVEGRVPMKTNQVLISALGVPRYNGQHPPMFSIKCLLVNKQFIVKATMHNLSSLPYLLACSPQNQCIVGQSPVLDYQVYCKELNNSRKKIKYVSTCV
jgi:hypothetical protein